MAKKKIVIQKCVREDDSIYHIFTMPVKASVAKFNKGDCKVKVQHTINDLFDAMMTLSSLSLEYDLDEKECKKVAKEIVNSAKST